MTWYRNIEQDKFCIKTVMNLLVVFMLYMVLGNLSWSNAAANAIDPADPVRVLLPIRCVELAAQAFLFYFALRLYTRKVLKKEPGYFRLEFGKLKRKWILAGILCPGVLVGIYLIFFNGTFEAGTLEVATGICLTFLHGGLKAGLTEEVLFRGFFMKLFENRWNRIVAVLLNSFLFAFIHLGNADGLSNLEIGMMMLAYTSAGITFSVITFRENSIGNAVVMHALWNIIAESNLLCIITSSSQYDANAIFNYRLHTGNTLLGGGFFGISSSIFAVAAFLAPLGICLHEYVGKKSGRPA